MSCCAMSIRRSTMLPPSRALSGAGEGRYALLPHTRRLLLAEVRRRPPGDELAILHGDQDEGFRDIPRVHGVIFRMHRDWSDQAPERPDCGQRIPELAPILQ